MKKLNNHFSKFLMLMMVVFTTSAMGQISANYFITGPSVGCGSLTVEFFDVSTGNPSSWYWDFGNGLTSTDQHPVMFFSPGVYDIVLKVEDSISFDIISVQNAIKVYELPNVNFTVNRNSGCLPLNVVFEDLSTSSSPIVSWFWDFGDGGNDSSSISSYQYQNEGAFDVSLLVIDANQCANLASFSNFIKTEERPFIDFISTPEFSCQSNQQVDFLNTTSNVTNYFYKWDFGDGQTSTLNNPSHIYSNQGIYDIALIASSSICIDTLQKTNHVTVEGSLGVDFSTNDSIVCLDDSVFFHNESSQYASDFYWDFGDGNSSTLSNPVHLYANPGQYDVSLKVSLQGNCVQQLTKQHFVEVNEKPIIEFYAIDSVSCQLPFLLKLKDTTLNATSWSWKLNDSVIGFNSIEQVFLTSSGIYDVSVEVIGANGCVGKKSKENYIKIDPINASFVSNLQQGCTPLEVGFQVDNLGLTPMAFHVWDFGDGNQSTTSMPIHTYQIDGIFDVSVNLKNEIGCMSSFLMTDYIKSTEPPITNFILSDTLICGNDSVFFTDLSQSVQPITSWYWDFDDQPFLNSSLQNPGHSFTDTGYHSVSLITEVNSCYDTLTMDSIVYVDSPLALFYQTQNCLDYNEIKFFNESVNLDSCVWDFGDGSFSNLINPIHNYAAYGLYSVTLSVYNQNSLCIGQLTKDIVVEPPYPALTIDSLYHSEGCPPLTVLFHDVSPYSDENPSSPYNVLDLIIFGDGNESHSNYINTYTESGYYDVKHVVGNTMGCVDTLTYDSLIHIFEANANFELGAVLNCNPFEIEMTDLSVSDDSIVDWLWKSDGQISNQQNPSFIFTQEGFYDVSLKIETNEGCVDTLVVGEGVNYQPVEASIIHSNLACLKDTVFFESVSEGIEVSLNWNFTNDTSSLVYAFYNTLGVNNVQLVATDAYQCSDTVISTIEITKPVADFTVDNLTSNCPPLICSFTDLSSPSVLAWQWAFSDSSNYSVQNPSKVFTVSGSYDATLIVIDSLGCSDTLVASDIIQLNGPEGIYDVTNNVVCKDETITFESTLYNASNVLWNFGDGTFAVADTVDHSYSSNGVYHPSMIISNSSGCQNEIFLDSIVVTNNSVYINDIGDFSVCPEDSVEVNIVTNGTISSWVPSIGVQDTSSTSTFIKPVSSTTYILSVEDGNCMNKDTIQIQVHQAVPQATVSSDSPFCVNSSFILSESVVVNESYQEKWEILSTTYYEDPELLFSNPGVYPFKLKIVSDSTMCYSILEDSLVINASPIIEAGENLILCDGDTATLIAQGGASYLWNNTVQGTDFSLLVDSTQLVIVEGTDSNGCSAIDDALIIVQPKPSLSFLGDIEICLGEELNLRTVNNANIFFNDTFTNHFKLIPTESFSLNIRHTSSAGCYDENNIDVLVNDTNRADLIVSNPICEGQLASISLSIDGPPLERLSWSIFNQTTTTDKMEVIFDEAGTYSSSVMTHNIHGCLSSFQIEDVIEVKKQPDIEIYQLNTSLTDINNTAIFQVSNEHYHSYNWDFGDGELSRLMNPFHEYLEDSLFQVVLEVKDADMCTNYDTLEVVVQKEYRCWIPNSFTPNNDGLDDFFEPLADELEYSMTIFNNWGGTVYNGYNKAWDGNLKNHSQAPIGTYKYLITTIDKRGKQRNHQGALHLLR